MTHGVCLQPLAQWDLEEAYLWTAKCVPEAATRWLAPPFGPGLRVCVAPVLKGMVRVLRWIEVLAFLLGLSAI
jgi:hypothetical protein